MLDYLRSDDLLLQIVCRLEHQRVKSAIVLAAWSLANLVLRALDLMKGTEPGSASLALRGLDTRALRGAGLLD